MKRDKQAIGTCECPIKGCAHVIPVFKYEGTEDSSRRRFAGRLYGICPDHKRIENQEYLLCHADLKNPPKDASESPQNNASDASPPASKAPPSHASPVVPTRQTQSKQTAPQSEPLWLKFPTLLHQVKS